MGYKANDYGVRLEHACVNVVRNTTGMTLEKARRILEKNAAYWSKVLNQTEEQCYKDLLEELLKEQ